MPKKNPENKTGGTDHKANALRLGMELYGYMHDRYYDAKRYREHCRCASPEHTSLVAAVDQCVGILSNWVFMASGHDYDLIERMESEAESICPDFSALVDKWEKDGHAKG